MHRPFYSKRGVVRPSVFTLFILLSFLVLPGLTVRSRAQGVYSAREQIYLKNVTPLLYEFSQVASEVSGSVLKLQSAPPEECASRFADYRGIVGSLTGQLVSLTPPQRLETVHSFAVQAMEGYSEGLGLYFKACTEEDYGVKESLVSQGGVHLNKSVVNIGKAYDEIENVKSAGLPVEKQQAAEQITEGEIVEETPTDGTAAGLVQENPPVPNPPAQQSKSKEEVLAEISQKVQADMEAQETEEKNAQAELVKGPSEPLVTTREEKPVPPVKEKAEAKVEETKTIVPEKTEAPETLAAEPTPVPPTETPSTEPVEEPAPEAASAVEENAEQQTGNAEESKETAWKETGKDKIDQLNQKIMEQAEAGGGSIAADETVPADDITPPAAENPDTAEPGVPAEGEAGEEIALVPPGGTPEEIKEEEVPLDDVKSWCEGRYQVKTEQEECMKHRAVAKDKIDKLSGSYSGGSQEREVLDKCMSDWKEGGTYNYEMVISCTQFFCTQRGIEDCKDLSK